MANKQTKFWLALLTLGENEGARIRYWNCYLDWKLPTRVKQLCRNIGNPPFNRYARDAGNPDLRLKDEEEAVLNELAARNGGHPFFPEGNLHPSVNYMDFSDMELDGPDFCNRLLVQASFAESKIHGPSHFSRAAFAYHTKFAGCVFLDQTQFQDADFGGTVDFDRSQFSKFVLFNGAKFQSEASFRETQFRGLATKAGISLGGVAFSKAQFCDGTCFDDASFNVRAEFEDVRFQSTTMFANTRFLDQASFERSTFVGEASFETARFDESPNFNSAAFQSSTSFKGAVFGKPPRFFETKLHEDTNFGDIDWRVSESSYAPDRKIRSSLPPNHPNTTQSGGKDIESVIRAWDRLILIMSSLERSPERHLFYRLRMRAQRWRDGQSMLSFVNWLFDATSEYGWSVPRALGSWCCHWLVGGVLLFFGTSATLCEGEGWLVLLQAVSTSFANAHLLLGLASEEGYLHEALEGLKEASNSLSLVKAVGVIQSFLGPMFLFVVLLTLRNRFRIR